MRRAIIAIFCLATLLACSERIPNPALEQTKQLAAEIHQCAQSSPQAMQETRRSVLVMISARQSPYWLYERGETRAERAAAMLNDLPLWQRYTEWAARKQTLETVIYLRLTRDDCQQADDPEGGMLAPFPDRQTSDRSHSQGRKADATGIATESRK